jgi:regulator of sigma E protease
MGVLTTILAFLVAIGLLIVVHELGHYAVARWCGVKVLRFSLGFGRPIARWTLGRDRTEWVIAAFPYGGYVRMLDEREADSGPIDPIDLPRAFNRQPVARRVAIVAAGPAANLLLAIGIYFSMNLVGVTDLRAVVARPAAGTLAAAAGLQEGDLVLGVDGEAVRSWKDLSWDLLRKVRSPDGRERRLRLDLSALDTDRVDGDLFARIGIEQAKPEPIVRALIPQEPAQLAGMQVGDRIVQIDGVPIATVAEIQKSVGASAGKPLQFRIERSSGTLQLAITPAEASGPGGARSGRIGVSFGDTLRIRDTPLPAIRHAVARTWDTSAFSLRILGRMIVGRASLQNLSGPVTIADAAGQSARIGLMAYLGFLALVSISLGVMNLLPVPVLDGGHLLYYAIEVLKGSPLSASWLELGQRLGIGLLIVLTALALYNDLTRLLFQ